jgi:hypothetical protein
MLEAYTPTPRRAYTYLAGASAIGGAVAGAAVGLAAGMPADAVASLAFGGAFGCGWLAAMVSVSAVGRERAAWFEYRAAVAKQQTLPAVPVEDTTLRVTRGGNIHAAPYHVIPNLNDKPRGKTKQATAQRVFQNAASLARMVVDGEIDGQPARLILDLNKSMWIMAQNIDRMEWLLGEKRWTEGSNHPFERTEYRALIDHLIARHILRRPRRSNTAPEITPSFRAVMEYWNARPCPARRG